MAIRLIECRRVLKNTGSIYLHCDSTMSHYLKLAMDCIFEEKNFRNEIIWHYQSGTGPRKAFKRKHDTLLFYSRSHDTKFNRQSKPVVNPKRYKYVDEDGRYYDVNGQGNRYYLDEGQTCDDVWTYIQEKQFQQINSQSKERTGYPTQKPLRLLQRIIKASSNKGDVVLDPFCGCATTCVTAEKLERRWIGIDVSVQAYKQVERRITKEVSYMFNTDQINFDTDPPTRTDQGKNYVEEKYVYIVSNPNFPHKQYKVGITNNWKSRLNTYQTSDPDRGFKMEYKYKTPLFSEIEKFIHQKYENKYNKSDEWVIGDINNIIQDIKTYRSV